MAGSDDMKKVIAEQKKQRDQIAAVIKSAKAKVDQARQEQRAKSTYPG